MRFISRLYKILSSLFVKSSKKEDPYPFLKVELQKKADSCFAKRLRDFKKKHNRKPDRNEIFLLVVSTSHDAIKQRTRIGHRTRQRVRKYLLLKNNIRKDYKMQRPKR
ncbi:MAG: hypothetical protein ABIH92_02885 [Nanoarchaeota archaeon]